jgi:vitamin B12 transporter
MQSRNITHHILALSIALALPHAAFAQSDESATELDEVVVTATRTQVAVQDSLLPVEVIDREEIERSQARSLQGLLQGRAGISLSNQGGLGKLTTINIRGTESDHVLVLVDGIRVGSATAGLAMFQDFPIDQIERVEIVRGPRSSLYGSEAIGGVIQIFTVRGGNGLQKNLRLGGGSHNLREAGGGFSYRGDRAWVSAQAAYQETDGINACRGTAAGWGAGCFADEPDEDGYRNISVNLRGGVNLTNTMEVEAHFLNADSFNEFDGGIYSGNESDNLQQVLGGRLGWTPSDRIKVTAQMGRALDEYDTYYADASAGTRVFVDTFDTRRDTASAQGDFGFGKKQLLSLGADWQRDDVTSTTAFDADSRDNTGVFVEYQGTFGTQQLQASVRNDDNEQFGNHTTGSLGWGMAFGSGFKLNATYGTGFKAPTFNDLYYPYFGNPDLKPESSKSLNIGLAQYASTWNWTFNAYETHVDDLVSYDAAISLPNNIEKARIRGAELTGAISLAGWDLAAQVSHADPRNRTDGYNRDNLLARRARDTARVDVDRAFGDFRFGLTANGAGHRFDDVANSVRLSGYGTLDLRMEYALHREWTLQARATNVFDRDYETIAWYHQPGREYGLSLRYQSAD